MTLGGNFISIQQNDHFDWYRWRLALANMYSKEMRENKKQSILFIFYFFSTPYNMELTFTYLGTLWYLELQSLLCPPLLQIHPRISHQKWRIKNAVGGFPASIFYFYFYFSKNTTTEEFFLKTKRFTYVFNMYLKQFIQISIFLLLLLPFFFLSKYTNKLRFIYLLSNY